MKSNEFVLVVVLSLLFAANSSSQEIPAGTVLPVMMSTTMDNGKSKPGDRVSGRLMQDVVLPSGVRLRTGARVEGQVVESPVPSASGGAHLAVRFDRLISGKTSFRTNVSLRALASMQDVFDAQLPVSAFDEYGTSISDWTTVQVGGAAVYNGDGTVRSALDIVGRTTQFGAVTATLIPDPKRGCPPASSESERQVSLWVFSPWACGTYGFDDLNIAHHGVTPPVGVIQLSSPASIQVRGGSGWLLRVVAAPPDAPSPAAS